MKKLCRFIVHNSQSLTEIAIVIAITAGLFITAKQVAYSQRGYEAIGGEYTLLMLPVLWYSYKATLIDLVSTLISRRK